MKRIVPAVLLFAVAVTATIVTGATSAGAVIPSDLSAAARYATTHGYKTGIAVLDTTNGQYWGGGSDTSQFATESVVKVFIATRLLLTGQMHGAVAATAYKMITQSDDKSANALYARVGGDGLEPWIQAHYRIAALGARPSRAGWWGNTKITPRGMAHFYAAAKQDGAVWPWLSNAMHHAAKYGSDGTDQSFGIPSATTGAAVKQGWGTDDNDWSASADFNTTGFVNSDRYVVVILTKGRASAYGVPISRMLSAQAKDVMPHGTIDNPANHNPAEGLDRTISAGGNVLIDGWTFDGDSSTTSLQWALYEGSKRLMTATTTVARPDVNAQYHISGIHGFSTSLKASAGPHEYCVVAYNVGPGTANPSDCFHVVVVITPPGEPRPPIS